MKEFSDKFDSMLKVGVKIFSKAEGIQLLLQSRLLKAIEMNKVKDLKVYKDLDKFYKLTALKAWDLSDKLEIYEHHHGRTKEFLEVSSFYEDFLIEQEDLMTQFFLWVEDGGDK